MTDIRAGACHCGSVKVEISSPDLFSFSCHCQDCKKLISGGRLLGFGVPESSLKITGETAVYSYAGGSGAPINLTFCPKCSTQISGAPTKFAGNVMVRANILDDQSGFVPGKHLFTEHAWDWENIKPD